MSPSVIADWTSDIAMTTETGAPSFTLAPRSVYGVSAFTYGRTQAAPKVAAIQIARADRLKKGVRPTSFMAARLYAGTPGGDRRHLAAVGRRDVARRVGAGGRASRVRDHDGADLTGAPARAFQDWLPRIPTAFGAEAILAPRGEGASLGPCAQHPVGRIGTRMAGRNARKSFARSLCWRSCTAVVQDNP